VIDLRQLRHAPDEVRAALERRGKPELIEQLARLVELDQRHTGRSPRIA
jgi:hypothetical protein